MSHTAGVLDPDGDGRAPTLRIGTPTSIGEIAKRLNERIADLARELFGESNRALSTNAQLRYGNKGSLAIELEGPRAGCWFDHEHGIGGDALDLVCHKRGYTKTEACDWAIDWLGWSTWTSNSHRAVSPAEIQPPIAAAPAINGDMARTPTINRDAERTSKVADIVADCRDPLGTCVEHYLRNRGIAVAPLPGSIRYLNRTIPIEERVENIGRRIAEEEADLLLAWAVDGASRLVRQRNFSIPTSCKQALADWIFGADPVLAWLDECVEIRPVIDGQPTITTRAAYEQFRDWAVAEGFKHDKLPAINGFVQRVQANARGIEHRRSKTGRLFVGLAIVRRAPSPSSW